MAPSNQSRTIPNPPAAKRLGALLVAATLLAGAPGAGFAGAQPIKLLAFGDSLVHGYGLAAGESFPQKLESALRARGYLVEVINAGNSGDTTAAGWARLDWALAEEPDLVLVELGANDGLRGIEPGETYRNLDHILARLAAEGLTVLFTGMRAPRNLGEDYVVEFDAVFPRLAEKYGVAFYPFFLEGVALDPSLNQDDGIHPNAAGVAVVVERIVPVLEPLLRGVVARRDAADG
jgi:acyl-CoA thioesterase-1